MGLIWACGTVYWIAWATVPGFIGTLLVVPFYSAFFCFIISFLYKKIGEKVFLSAPFFWVGLEILSSWGQLAFPWNFLGYTLTSHLALIQHADFGGVYGVSFWIVVINVLLYKTWNAVLIRRKDIAFYYGCAAFLLFAVTALHGSMVLSRSGTAGKNIRIANIQGNIDPYQRWTQSFVDSNLALYRNLSFESAANNPDIIVWPETASACYLRNRIDRLLDVKDIADRTGAALLTGSPDYDWIDYGKAKTYNTALYFRPNDDDIGRYHKMKLVPFSEKVPFAESIPGLYSFFKKAGIAYGDFTPGDSLVLFSLSPASIDREVQFAASICYDSVFPDLNRRFVKAGAGFLIIITNDGWFGNTSGPVQHLRIAALRAVENRVWISRCATTGISACIDPYGRILRKTKYNEQAVLVCDINSRKENEPLTFYTRFGGLIEWMVQIVNIFILAYAALFLK